MRSMTRRRLAASAVGVALVAGAAMIALPYVHGLSFIVRIADLGGTVRRVANFDTTAVRTREVGIPLPDGPLRARIYELAGRVRRIALLVSGLHPSGIEEPRLVRLARELSASGITVVTPDIADLSQLAITPAITDAIEQSASWLASQQAFAPDGLIGMIGVSFSGGLSVVAAGRPSLRGRVAYVLSVGGHDDLPRVLRYLCTGVEPPPPGSESALNRVRLKTDSTAAIRLEPDTAAGAATSAAGDVASGWAPLPHDHGVAVILLGVADRLVPPAQVGSLKAAVRRFLQASAWDRDQTEKAAQELAALRTLAKSLPEPSATLLGYVNDRDIAHLGARLVPQLGFYADSPALSAAKSPKPSAPVFLLHGTADNVIPAAESVHLAAALRSGTRVRVLLSGLIPHADADGSPRVAEVMELASFWGDLLGR